MCVYMHAYLCVCVCVSRGADNLSIVYRAPYHVSPSQKTVLLFILLLSLKRDLKKKKFSSLIVYPAH